MLNKQRIPNALTFARMAAVPVALAVILYNPRATEILFWLFALAAITDFFDGYLARKWNVESQLGKLLDPMADKLLVALLLIYLLTEGELTAASRLTFDYRLQSLPLFLPIILILLRELYIAGLREFLSARGIALPVSKGGKWKTAVQMVAILLLLFSLAYGNHQAWGFGALLLWIAGALAITSAAGYTRQAWPNLK